MTKICFIAILLLALGLTSPLFGQLYPVTATLQVMPPYTPSLTDFADPTVGIRANGIRLNLVLNDFKEPSYQVKLRLSLEGPGILLRTNENAIPSIINLSPGVPVILDNAALAPYFDATTMDIAGIDLQSLFTTGGRLPEGNYLMFVEALDILRNVVVSNTAIFPMYAEELDPPEIISPIGDQLVVNPQILNFTWWKKHLGNSSVRYSLAIYDTLPGLSDAQIVELSTPMFYTQVNDITQYTYQPYDPPLLEGHTYLVRVRAEDLTGQLAFKRNGFSELARFRWGKIYPDIPACLPPSNLEGSRSNGQIQLSWLPPTGDPPASSYFLHWRIDGSTWQIEQTTQLSLVLNDPSRAQKFEVFVSRSCGEDSEDQRTATLLLPGLEDDCQAPLISSAALQEDRSYRLAWGATLASLYEIEITDEAQNHIDLISTSENQIDLIDLDTSQNYQGYIYAVCDDTIRSEGTPFFINCTGRLPDIVYECGIPVDPLRSQNYTPIPSLNVGDTILAGDFKVRLSAVSGGAGIFSGTGTMIWNFPLRNFLNPDSDPIAVAINFDQIKVNTEYFMYEGFMNISGLGLALIPPTLSDFLTEFSELAFVNEQFENPATLMQFNFTIEQATFVDGIVTILGTDDNGDTITETIPWHGDDIELIGTDGKVYVVDANGNLKDGGVLAEGGTPTSQNTDGVDDQGRVTELVRLGITFRSAPNDEYAFDDVSNDASANEKKLYPPIPIAGEEDPYHTPFKAIITDKADELMAEITDLNLDPDDLLFKAQSGRQIEHTLVGNTFTLKLQGLFSDAREAIYATHKLPDGHQEVVGVFNLIHMPGMDLHLTLLPLHNATIPSDAVATIQDIYATSGVNLTISTADPIALPPDLLGPDHAISTEGSTTFANYSDEQQAINRFVLNALGDNYRNDTYYLLFTEAPSSTNLAGFMPLKRQFGYLFSGGDEEAKSTQSLVAAHELGHGVFALKHPFSEYNIPQGTTNWLMDYANGDQLAYRHWDQIYNPDFEVYLFQGDEQGEQIVAGEAFLYSNYVYFAKTEHPDQPYAGLTPSGHRFILPPDAVAAFYPREDANWPKGALAGFQIGSTSYFGWWNKSNQIFLGYATGALSDQNQLRKTGEYFPSLSDQDVPVYSGWAETACLQQIYWQETGNQNALSNSENSIASVLSFGDFTPYEEAQVPQTNCGCYQGDCQELLETYKNHPYLTSDHILKRVICANPCVLRDFEHHQFLDAPPSQWMEDLHNICASLLAFGFTPALLAGAGIGLEGVLAPILQGIASQTAAQLSIKFSLGSVIDMLIQTATYFYFPENDEPITWSDAYAKVNYISSAASGVEATILLESKLAEVGISAAISCFIDGNINDGRVLENFEVNKCAQGALSAIAIHGLFGVSTVSINYLRQLPADRIINGFLRFFNSTPPGVHAAGYVPDGSTLWMAIRSVFSDDLNANQLKSLFNISDAQVTQNLLEALKDPLVKSDLLESGLFLKIRNLDLPANVRADLIGDLLESKEFRDLIAENDGVVKAWDGAIDFPNVRKDIDFLESFSKALDDATLAGPPVNIQTRLKDWIQNSHLKCRTCLNGSEPFLDEVLDNLYAFKAFLSKPGATKIVDDIGKSTRGAEGANWVMKFTRERGINPSTFEEIITDGRKFTADIVEGSGSTVKYFECKSWDSNMKSLFTPGNTNFAAQFTNYLHNADISNLSQFGYHFNPAKWTPSASDLNAALKASSGLFKSDVATWAKYRQLFGPEVDNIVTGDIDGLVDIITNSHFSKFVNPS